MYLGFDLGTPGVKAVLVGSDGAVIGQATAPLTVSAPQPLWREQDPAAWWQATCDAIARLRSAHDLGGVRAVGLCGQMHGAALLGAADKVLRPAILWNDGRSHAQCVALEAAEPRSNFSPRSGAGSGVEPTTGPVPRPLSGVAAFLRDGLK